MIPIPISEERSKKLVSIDVLFGKLPRPDRSGWLAVAIMCICLWTTANHGSGSGEASLFWTTICVISPIGCPVEGSGEKTGAISDSHRLTYVLTSPFPSKGGDSCTCHADVQLDGKEIDHLIQNTEQVSCRSDLYVFHGNRWDKLEWDAVKAREWQSVYAVQFGNNWWSLGDGTPNAKVRWHCTVKSN